MSVGSEMRCPKCNKYLPDRCTCNGPSTEDRRAAPIAAQLDAELPPPVGQIRTDIERTNAIWIGPLPPHGTNLHTAEQLRQHVAPYAERIRLLTEELAAVRVRQDVQEVVDGVDALKARVRSYQQPAQSIDTPEFRRLVNEYREACEMVRGHATPQWRNLIAYIDGRTAGTASDAWQPIETAPKDGREVLLYLGEPYSRIAKAFWHAPWENWQENEVPHDHDEYGGIGSACPTHWMPIPAAPSPQENTK